MYRFQRYFRLSVAVYGSLITVDFFIIITLTRIVFKKRIAIMKLLHFCEIVAFLCYTWSKILNFSWQEMHISLFFLEKKEWNLKCFHSFREMKSESFFSFHSFREWKVKWKSLEIEIESEKWNENAPRSRSRSEIGKKFSRILEKRDSRRVLTAPGHPGICCLVCSSSILSAQLPLADDQWQ